jgi:hypothetical protein
MYGMSEIIIVPFTYYIPHWKYVWIFSVVIPVGIVCLLAPFMVETPR